MWEDRKRGALPLLFGMAAAVAVTLFVLGLSGYLGEETPGIRETMSGGRENASSAPVTAEERLFLDVYYEDCAHTLRTEPEDRSAYLGKSEAELKAMGISCSRTESGALLLSCREAGLCPRDAEMRHIEVRNEMLAVCTGGAGTTGEVLYFLPVTIDRLPAEWQARIRENSLEFASEDELFEALDNLDEF